jgi:hypothetical protein
MDVEDFSLPVVFPKIYCASVVFSKVPCSHVLQAIQEDCVLTLREVGE